MNSKVMQQSYKGNPPLTNYEIYVYFFKKKKSKILRSQIEFNRFSQHQRLIASKKRENSIPSSTKTKGVTNRKTKTLTPNEANI